MIETLIRTSALFILVAIASYALRNRSAAMRHMLWSFAIAGAVLLPALTKIAPFQWRVLPASAAATPQAPAGSPGSVDDKSARSAAENTIGREAAAEHAVDRAAAAENEPFSATGPSSPPLQRLDLMTAFTLLWGAGALILLARLVAGLVTVQRIANRATEITDDSWRALTDRAIRALDVRVPVEVRRSDEIAMPFACGLTRPIIVLPANTDTWNAAQREAVLLHELAHVSRGDLAMNALSHVMRAAYWVNPLAWLAAHRLRVEGEKAADDAVLRGGARPSDYADHLLSIVRTVGNTVPNVALAMARRSDFEGRLLAILEPGVSRDRMSRVRAFTLAALFVAATLPLAGMTRAGAPAPTSAEIEWALNQPPASQAQPNTAPLPEAGAAVQALASAITDESFNVRLAAVQSLGNLQDPAAIAALAEALKKDTDARVREAAAWSLGEIDDNRAVPHLLEALRAEKVVKVKVKIVEALREIDDPSAMAGIIAVQRDAAPEVRRAAASALAQFDDPNARTALLTMTRDDDVQVRREVAQHIGDLESSAALEALIAMARDADDEVRANAIGSLHHFEDSRVVPAYVSALKDKNAHVRQHAAEGFGNIEDLKDAPGALIDALQDSNRDVRRSAANALGHIGDEAAVPALKRLVGDNDTETRRHAVEALKEIGGTEAITALMGLLKDPDPEVRKTAAEALGKRRGN
jgi:HEAT repeat protein/beta-lactamase regulating signal transducer with metallopeptidase domain